MQDHALERVHPAVPPAAPPVDLDDREVGHPGRLRQPRYLLRHFPSQRLWCGAEATRSACPDPDNRTDRHHGARQRRAVDKVASPTSRSAPTPCWYRTSSAGVGPARRDSDDRGADHDLTSLTTTEPLLSARHRSLAAVRSPITRALPQQHLAP
jgi:hypothetical protein